MANSSFRWSAQGMPVVVVYFQDGVWRHWCFFSVAILEMDHNYRHSLRASTKAGFGQYWPTAKPDPLEQRKCKCKFKSKNIQKFNFLYLFWACESLKNKSKQFVFSFSFLVWDTFYRRTTFMKSVVSLCCMFCMCIDLFILPCCSPRGLVTNACTVTSYVDDDATRRSSYPVGKWQRWEYINT